MTTMTRKAPTKTASPQSFHTVEWSYDNGGDHYRVRRAIWPHDTFDLLTHAEFEDLKNALSKPVVVSLFPTILVELVD